MSDSLPFDDRSWDHDVLFQSKISIQNVPNSHHILLHNHHPLEPADPDYTVTQDDVDRPHITCTIKFNVLTKEDNPVACADEILT
eukprot:12691361-Ditylum_brightwellii.AAC.1